MRAVAPRNPAGRYGRGAVRVAAVSVLTTGLALAAPGPRPPVFPALELGWELVDPGERLLVELHCTACHAPGQTMESRLQPLPGPDLERVAVRLRPEYLHAWRRDPLRAKPGTTMPDLLHGLTEAEREAAVEELAHYLRSLAPAPAGAAGGAPGRLLREQGRVLYHQTGCVACHAPFEPAAAVFPRSVGAPTEPQALQYALQRLQDTSVPLPDLAAKYRPEALAEFLRDPLAARPAGRMPSMNLTEAEARALAAYLIQATAGGPAFKADDAPPAIEPAKVRRGRERFAALGCAACHSAGASEARAEMETRPRAPALLELRPEAPAGCLAEAPDRSAPRYVLSAEQRAALRETLRNRMRLEQPPGPAERVAHTLAALNCTACHSRDGYGGPTPARSDYFTTLGEADLGDEGRIPPHLSGVGFKLREAWLGQVLTNRGVVRPYLAVRMPQYGPTQVGHLPADLRRADAGEAPAPPPAGADLEAGRALTGLGGYGCIQCHRFGPHPALGVSVMDLTRMAERLEWPWFRLYLLDPAGLRPGTRMPAFWPEGRATLTTVLEGDTERQIAALWQYLCLGLKADPPPGLLEHEPREVPSAEDYE